MRIVHITATFPPYSGGTGNVCYYNARELARRGHDVHVYTVSLPGTLSLERIAGVQVHRLWPVFQMGNAPFLPGLLKLDRFDIIHLHYPFIFGAELVWLIRGLRHIPYVFTYHNDLIGSGIRRILFDCYLAFSAPLIFASAARLITVSNEHAENCKLAVLFKKRWNDVVEIPNGIDKTIFHPGYDARKSKKQQSIPVSAKVILFVGGLDRAHHYKGVDNLLEAFAILARPETWLLIVGDGDLRAGFIEKAKLLGIIDRTVFAGQLQHAELPEAIAAADMLVLPSFAESFGMALIEAMACGKPVIASDLPGVHKIVTEGKNGLFFTPGNVNQLVKAIQNLLDNPEMSTQMGQAGLRVVEQYAWEVVVDKLLATYQKVLNEE